MARKVRTEVEVGKLELARMGAGGWFFEDAKRPGSYVHKWAGGRVRGSSWRECWGKRVAKDERAARKPGSVADACDRWLERERAMKGDRLAGNTDVIYERSVVQIKSGLGENTDIASVTFGDIEAMLLALASPPHNWSRDTLIGLVGYLRRVCRFAIREGMMTANPCEAVELPERAPRRERKRQERKGVAAEGKDKANFTLEEHTAVRQLLTAEHSPVNVMFLVMLDCGLRPSEAWGLRWDCVDIAGRTLKVESTVSMGRDGVFRPTAVLKTDHKGDWAHRTVPMTSALAAALAELRLAQGEAREFVFYEWAGICRSTLKTGAAGIARAAGVPRGTAYCFRHTFASVMLHKRFTHRQVADLMGHADERMVIGWYSGTVSTVTGERLDRAFAV